MRRSEVVGVAVDEISPVEMALQEVQQRTRELEALNVRYSALAKTGQLVSTTPLAMSLNAVVDAPLDTGVASFRQSFLTGDYALRFPDREEQIEKLRAAIDDQVRVSEMVVRPDQLIGVPLRFG